MERNKRLEAAMEKAYKNLGEATGLMYADPRKAVDLLNAADESIHIAHDEICDEVKK